MCKHAIKSMPGSITYLQGFDKGLSHSEKVAHRREAQQE